MASNNTLISKGGVVEKEEKVITPLDQLPDVAYPTWMSHDTKSSILVNSKKEYYDAIALGYYVTDKCVKK